MAIRRVSLLARCPLSTLLTPLNEKEPDLTRRSLLKAGMILGIAAASPLSALAADFWDQPRRLRLYRPDTKEQADVVYWEKGQLNYAGYYQACQLLRDIHQNQAVQMDTTLFDVLCGVQGWYRAYGFDSPLLVNSGFRTLKTNNSLLSEGAARNSMHLYGKAADIRMPNVPARHLGQVGLYFRQGGVGFYETRNFVHLDTGRLRVWRG